MTTNQAMFLRLTGSHRSYRPGAFLAAGVVSLPTFTVPVYVKCSHRHHSRTILHTSMQSFNFRSVVVSDISPDE